MPTDISADQSQPKVSKRFSFGIGHLLMLIALVAVCFAWWIDHNQVAPREYSIDGPLTLSYKVRTSPNSTSGGSIGGVKGIDVLNDTVIVHTEQGGTVFSSNNLINFVWNRE